MFRSTQRAQRIGEVTVSSLQVRFRRWVAIFITLA